MMSMMRYCNFLKATRRSKDYGLFFLRRSLSNSSPFVIDEEVQAAIASNRPVVALESTIVTHGMPYPHNLKTAVAVENIVKEQGAVPATIGILKGKVHVGLSYKQLETLAEKKGPCMKTSRRDLPYVLAKDIDGGTTVSGTMLIAQKVGIPLFVTGGIGGVHRGAKNSFDISADLTELGRTLVTVVSAGVKSILDVRRTLEYLETQGVCVSVLGEDSTFPDFFTRDSGHKAPCHVETPFMAASMMKQLKDFNMNSGMLIAVPIPTQYEAEGQKIKDAIETAVQEAASTVSGRDVTPFILQRVFEITGGQSLKSNIALIKNNAQAGAQIAVEYSKMLISPSSFIPYDAAKLAGASGSKDRGRPVVVGGSVVDFIMTVKEPKIKFNGMSHKGHIVQSYGGVGRNLGDALTRLQCHPLLISAVGTDNHAKTLVAHNPKLECSGLAHIPDISTATYCAILNAGGENLFGIADMAIHDYVTPQHVKKFEEEISRAPLVILDGNVPLATVGYVLEHCAACKVPVWYEPTDIQKATKPWISGYGPTVAFSSPNINELRALCTYLHLGEIPPAPLAEEHLSEWLTQILRVSAPLLDHMKALMVTMDRNGFMILRNSTIDKIDDPLLPVYESEGRSEENQVFALHFKGKDDTNVVSVSGAGDCLASGFICGMLQQKTVTECSALGLRAAAESLKTSPAVPETLSLDILPWGKKQSFTMISSS